MTTGQTAMVVGLFEDRAQAEQAVSALEQAGFSHDQISYSGYGTANGGGVLAGLKSLFTGEDTSTHHVADDLTSMGMPTEDARYYQQEYEAGRSIVAVVGDRGMQEASMIMAQYGGYDAKRRHSTMADSSTSAVTDTATTAQDMATNSEGRRLQLREEQLQVSKQPVQTGEVNLHKDVVTEQQNIDVPVTHEEVYIERRPASGQVSDTPIGDNETINVPVSREQVNVSKQSVVTGEVAVGKRTVQETQQVSDTVRHEEARVDRTGNAAIQGDNAELVSDQSEPTNP